MAYILSGVVTEDGAPVAREVRAYDRNTGSLIASDVSDAVTGEWRCFVASEDEHYVVALDDEYGGDFNALIYDRVLPLFDEAVDEHFANVSALLHFNGANGSTTFTDVTGKVWTPYNGVAISTAQSKFGGASGLFNGTSHYLDTVASADFTFGTGDFTLELQYRPDSVPGGTYRNLLADLLYVAAGGWSLYQFGAGIEFWRGGAPAVKIAEKTSGLAANTWAHIEVSRVAGITKAFIDGVPGSGGTDTTDYTNNRLQIGHVFSTPTHYYAMGYIDEVRVTKGVGRHTSTFTPPTVPLPDM